MLKRSTDSLQTLLDSGWAVTAMAGADGQVLIIAKGGKWIRCDIVNTAASSMLRLSMAPSTGSICQQMN